VSFAESVIQRPMQTVTSQHLLLISTVLIPFIPDNTMRYIALVFASLSFAAYLVLHNAPTCQVARLDSSVKNTDELFRTAVDECAADPRFILEAGLKLTEAKYAVSNLHTKAISTKHLTWKTYPHHFVHLALSIDKCHREIGDLGSSILLELELTRQQKFKEDINHRLAVLVRTFPPDARGA
ncbi:hypothetical protein FB451DRAFT_1268781, partial [Mycena latifolia]